MQSLLRPLILGACALVFAPDDVRGQLLTCPDEPIVFQLADTYYGTKIWEHSSDGLTWTPVDVVENEPLNLLPEQAGWYRVRFHDADCDTSYISDAVRVAVPTIDLGATIIVNIGGQVMDEWGMPLAGATVRAGCGSGISTTTDHFGVFLLTGVEATEDLARVMVQKEGYFNGSRSFVPADSAAYTISRVHIKLLAKDQTGMVLGTSGGAVALDGVTITFPENAFVQNGQPYAGEVIVSLDHIDPTSDDLHQLMPGMLMGVMNEEPQLLLSYGMVGAELNDASGQAVQLASGITATVRFPVMPDQQLNAPPSIPLWWFDEALGYWVQEGEAQRVANEYIGQVTHFSWWNVDVPDAFMLLQGKVVDLLGGNGLANARVEFTTQTMGDATLFTDDKGEFAGQFPIGQVMTLQVWLPCETSGAYQMIHEEVIGPFSEDTSISIPVEALIQSVIQGQVIGCAGLPVEQGYVWANGNVVFCTDGAYRTSTCAEQVSIRGVDLTSNTVSEFVVLPVSSDTMDVADLLTCTPLDGTVMDVDGNTYQTILIGNRTWMAENLRTSRRRDGTEIPNVTSNTSWPNLSTAAWSNYDNDPLNDALYGKIYNGFAASDTLLCPQGWHVSTDADWLELELTLGMLEVNLGDADFRGSDQNVGGKLKSTAVWNAPNVGATDQSGFTGLPAGFRSNGDGEFMNMGNDTYWWCSSDVGLLNAYWHGLNHMETGIKRVWSTKRNGFSVRCVMD